MFSYNKWKELAKTWETRADDWRDKYQAAQAEIASLRQNLQRWAELYVKGAGAQKAGQEFVDDVEKHRHCPPRYIYLFKENDVHNPRYYFKDDGSKVTEIYDRLIDRDNFLKGMGFIVA